jgi:hypothetical protein
MTTLKERQIANKRNEKLYDRESYCECGTKLVPHPNAKNVPLVHASPDYLICPTMKCGHHNVDHDYEYPGFWDHLFNPFKPPLVKCKRPRCLHTHVMWEGH